MSTILITGCSSGIGLEIALAFARRGDTTCASMRNPAKAAALRDRAAAEDLTVEVVTMDVTDDASVASAVSDVEKDHGAVDVLVNNAGVGHIGSVETLDIAKAQATMETNFWGAVRTIRAVLPGMRARRSGVIVNVTSIAGRAPGATHNAFYCASKHALGALSEGMVQEVEPFGIRLACIEPGFFKTSIVENSGFEVADGDPYAAHVRWANNFYEKGVAESGGDPAMVAEAVLAAATDPETPLHTVVGDDGKMFVDAASQVGSFEEWASMSAVIVEGIAGPRPPLD